MGESNFLWWLVLYGLVCSAVGFGIGDSKGRGAQGALLGIVLGPLGWIVVGLMEPTEEIQRQRTDELAAAIGLFSGANGTSIRQCPHCAEDIKAAAKVCRHCNRDVEPLTSEPAAQRRSPDSSLRNDSQAGSTRRVQIKLEPPGWFKDPTKRHERRYWDGSKWTNQVMDGRNPQIDPMDENL